MINGVNEGEGDMIDKTTVKCQFPRKEGAQFQKVRGGDKRQPSQN